MTPRYDGLASEALAERLALPRVVLFDEVPSTQDVAHALAAEGAPAGTLVLADAQSGGRGTGGRRWVSPSGAGIWMTLVARPRDASALGVLSLRLGLRAAAAVESFADGAVQVKWPNDLLVGGRKLAGILVEARWRDSTPEWVAIGFGLNVRAPAEVAHATGLAAQVERLAVLEALVPALVAASGGAGMLDAAELRAFAERDAVTGRRLLAPRPGVACGIAPTGELLVEDAAGLRHAVRQGSIAFAS